MIQERGGRIETVENLRLFRKHGIALHSKDSAKTRKKDFTYGLLRTLHFVRNAKRINASFLIVGADHARHIKKIMGKKATVRTIAPQESNHVFREEAAFIKRIKETHPKRFESFRSILASTTGAKRKMKRPRIGTKNQNRRRVA